MNVDHGVRGQGTRHDRVKRRPDEGHGWDLGSGEGLTGEICGGCSGFKIELAGVRL